MNHIEGVNGNRHALRYVLDNPYVTSAMFGTTTMEHLKIQCGSRNKENNIYS